MNEVNILKKFRNLNVNGICNESDDVVLIEMIKVLKNLLTVNSNNKKITSQMYFRFQLKKNL